MFLSLFTPFFFFHFSPFSESFFRLFCWCSLSALPIRSLFFAGAPYRLCRYGRFLRVYCRLAIRRATPYCASAIRAFVGAPYRLCRYGRFFLLALPIGFADTVAFCASIAGWQYAARRPIAQAQYGLLGALCWRIRAPQCGSPCGYRTATTTFRDLSPCLRFPSSPIRHAADMAH